MERSDICKKCGGRCCNRRNPCMSEQEKKTIEAETGGAIPIIEGVCAFNKNGCTLNHKPLGCRIFPFKPTVYGWSVVTNCPFWDSFTNKDLMSAKEEFEGNKSDWLSPYSILEDIERYAGDQDE